MKSSFDNKFDSKKLKERNEFEVFSLFCFIISTINSTDYSDDYVENDEYERYLYEPDRKYRYLPHFHKECKKRRYFHINR